VCLGHVESRNRIPVKERHEVLIKLSRFGIIEKLCSVTKVVVIESSVGLRSRGQVPRLKLGLRVEEILDQISSNW
jgi:hypothetical protein